MDAAGVQPAACTRCGTFYKNERDVFYTDAGDKVCRKCFEVADLQATAQRYANRVRSGAYAAPLLAVGALVGSMMFGIIGMFLLGAVALSAGGMLVAIARDSQLRSNLGGHLVPACLCAAVGVIISGGCLALTLLGLGAAIAMRR